MIKEIRKWIGGDPGYAGFTIRGPAYIAGWHKDNPTRECGNYIDTVTQSLWHETTWYEPHLYTLDELRELAKFLKSLHAPTTNQEFVAALGETPTSKKKTVYNNENDVHSLGRPTVDKKVANIIPDGERNVSMFDLMRQYAYRNAWRFNNDTSALAKHLFEKFSSINTQRCSPPLPACAIRATSYSVAKFCIMKGFKKPTRKTSKGYTDEDRAYAHLIKYGPNHVTQKEIAATEKVCVRTIIRRNKKSKEAANYMAKHGRATWASVRKNLDRRPKCPKLQTYWQFHDCRYQKTSGTCAEPNHIDTCPLPSHQLRNGHLNQMAYSLYLFIRDVADGDLVGWIDDRLEEAHCKTDTNRATRGREGLIEPLRNVYGISDKVLAMALSAILIGAADVRPAWLDIGVQLIAVDSLVHNFLVRSGILSRFNAAHPYGPGCYRPNGCADVIRLIASQYRRKAVQSDLSPGLSPVRATRDLAVLQPVRP